jgi:nickel-dependent lactate racemase
MSASLVQIAFGNGHIPFEMDPALAEWRVIAPRHHPPIPDPKRAFFQAGRNPIGSPPLRERVRPRDSVVIVTSDGTRPVPNRLLIPWLLEELPVPPEQVTVLIGTGTHRPNTEDEIVAMLGAEVARRVRVVNHNAYDAARNEYVGQTASGAPVLFDKAYVNADKRIAVGFIEPHFFAGFSGGAKAIAPGVAAIDSILHLHGYGLIAHPNATWGALDGNPVYETMHAMIACCPPDFLVNVTLNNEKAITGFFLGDYRDAHRAGCTAVREQALTPVPHPFPLVITSNSGFPLDQNLYQSVKGMSAAARIVTEGGAIFMASECGDGIPAHSNFGAILREHATIKEIDAFLRGLTRPIPDQWQAQALIQILKRCKVCLYARLDVETVTACKLQPVADLQRAVREQLDVLGKGVPVAVLPEGPLTIPYVDA